MNTETIVTVAGIAMGAPLGWFLGLALFEWWRQRRADRACARRMRYRNARRRDL